MAYDSDNAVSEEKYCMPSWQKRNVDTMNAAMGYEATNDRANTPKPPSPVRAASSNPQVGPQAGNGKYNY